MLSKKTCVFIIVTIIFIVATINFIVSAINVINREDKFLRASQDKGLNIFDDIFIDKDKYNRIKDLYIKNSKYLPKMKVDNKIKLMSNKQLLLNLKNYPVNFLGKNGDPVPPFIVFEVEFFGKGDETIDVVVEIVNRGINILPDLLDNIEDSNNTDVSLPCGGYVEFKDGMSAGNPGGSYFDIFKSHDKKFLFNYSKKLNTDKRAPLELATSNGKFLYYLKKGELCYELIDQIGNQRNYCLRRDQDQDSPGIASPVKFKEIADATRLVYSNLTEKEHKKMLVKTLCFYDDCEAQSIRRLIYYYPDFTREIFSD